MVRIDEQRSSRSVTIWLAALLALITIYLLSVGPAVVLRDNGYVTREAFVRIYTPLVWLDRCVPFFGSFLNWYARVWTAIAALAGLSGVTPRGP